MLCAYLCAHACTRSLVTSIVGVTDKDALQSVILVLYLSQD